MNKIVKYIALVLSLVILLSCFTACGNKEENITTITEDNSTADIPVTEDSTKKPENLSDVNVDNLEEGSTLVNNSSEKNDSIVNEEKPQEPSQKPDKNEGNSIEEELKTTEVITYYSDNPNNKYIKMVAKKYGVDKSNLVALIKVNATYPGATVLEFTGDRDEDGKLIFSKKTLVAMYDISDVDGTVKCAHRNPSMNDGYTEKESKKMFMIFELFALNSLNDMRENRVYPE